MNKNNIGYIFFIAFIFLSIFIMYKLLRPFGMIIFFAVVFYVILNPLFIKAMGKSYKKTDKLSIIKKNTLALLFSLISLIIFLVPTSILAYTIIVQLIDISNIGIKYFMNLDVNEVINNSNINNFLKSLPIDVSMETILKRIQDSSLSNLTFISSYLTQNVAGLLKSTGGFVSSFIFMMFSLFFFFVDGEYLIGQVRTLVPIDEKYLDRLIKQVSEGIKGIVFGNLFTGIFQGFCAFIVYTVFGVTNSFTFAFLTIIASFMPIIGTTIIWIPLGILFLINGEIIRAIIFIVCSWFFITIPDNFVRPLLLGNRIELHPLFIFFAILGGVLFFGLSGIILGPLSFILFFEIMKIYNEERLLEAKKERIAKKRRLS
ncbi:AI-2E family transporter [Brachyspira hyodysenteriae]|uniref:AI-2E family transporter n=1 Tax=Brachyspira hyodysenteriae TaxID=159 RepID=UPI00063DA22A|nr:AI-2E family transporter [Brachyspira hyodysenteriae]KLI52741.1 membrane protein [Brachyspira hyodysenteriae]KLI58013.1 membrane protein [Brachyspira hyodysenteriae]MCZ9893135.1 AI-2E family transporter [Brachyspira hyodysenteriae]MCZ9940025.1 AI-2E family transporter [Brachyspira hyodysenteriae]MDA0001762.1 AI-2E family transporter [Brachyspira hyodysenteriae]